MKIIKFEGFIELRDGDDEQVTLENATNVLSSAIEEAGGGNFTISISNDDTD